MNDIVRTYNVMVRFSKGQSLTTKLVVGLNYNLTTYFRNLTVELHILYALNTHVKFCVHLILFTIRLCSYFMQNFKL